jgi:exosortase
MNEGPSLTSQVSSYGFIATLLTSLAVFWALLHDLVKLSGNSEYSYIPLIPLISGFVIFLRRDSIFRNARSSPRIGISIVAAGMVMLLLGHFSRVGSMGRIELSTLAIVGTWCGLFVIWYGPHAARMALLPLSLLLFMVPAPESVLNAVIGVLQQGSTVLSYELFRLLGVPALREGTVISLPGLTIQIAPECSGIRSSISLLILTLVAANLYLRSGWNKVGLVLTLAPLVVVKNAIRIVTLSLLAIYVDPGFLNGPLHHRGGVFVFLIALMILTLIVIVMRSRERRGATDPSTGARKPG